MFRRVATRFSHGSHWDLGMVIYHEKMVAQSLRKMIEAKRQASTHLAKWLKSEANAGLRDLFMAMYEVDTLWTELLDDYMNQYEHYRKQFKEILTETKNVDEARKDFMELKGKAHKLEKHLDQLMKKGEKRKVESTQAEYVKATSLMKETQQDLEAKTDALNTNKHCRAREAVKVLAEANRVMHEKGLHVAMAQRQLVAVLMPRSSPSCQTKEGSFKGKIDSARVVGNLSDKIELPRPRKFSEIDVGYTFKTHQYIPSRELLMQEFSQPVQRRQPQPLPTRRNRGTWHTDSTGSGEYAVPGEQKPEPPPRPDNLILKVKVGQNVERRTGRSEPRPLSLELPSPSDFEIRDGTCHSSGSGASYISFSQINGRSPVGTGAFSNNRFKSQHPTCMSPKDHPIYRSCSDPNILDSIERSRKQWSMDSDSDDPEYFVFNG